MKNADAQQAMDTLRRLQGYLGETPENPALLAEVCDAAIACGDHAAAKATVETARQLQLDPVAWGFRGARVALVTRDLAGAVVELERLRARVGEQPTVVHDLAYAHLLAGEYEESRALTRLWIDGAPEGVDLPAAALEAFHALWLRACHHLYELEEPVTWAKGKAAAGALSPRVAGVACLMALDNDDAAAAGEWSNFAIQHGVEMPEPHVVRGMLALGSGDSGLAAAEFSAALKFNPNDGRTWSGLGYASLMSSNLDAAKVELERAVSLMPGHVGTWHALGWTKLLKGDQAGALADFEQALSLDRSFAETHGAIGLVLAMQGRRAEAERFLETADRLDRANVTGRYARSVLSGEAADPSRLPQLIRRLLDRPGPAGKLSDAVEAGLRRRR